RPLGHGAARCSRLRRGAKDDAAALRRLVGRQSQLAAVAFYLLAADRSPGDAALLGADGDGSAADRLAPARAQIVDHQPVFLRQADLLPGGKVIHELDTRRIAAD